MYHLKYLTIMSLNYSIAMMGNPLKKEEPKKAYAKAQTNGELSLKELSTLIASKCTVHQADVSAVLIATTECMLEGLKAGKFRRSGCLPPPDQFRGSAKCRPVHLRLYQGGEHPVRPRRGTSSHLPRPQVQPRPHPGRPSRRHQGPEGR